MAIILPAPPTPASIPTIKVILYHSLPTEDNPSIDQGISYQLEVRDQNGVRYRFPQDQGNALPHLADDEIIYFQEHDDVAYFQDFIERFRAYAESQVIE